MLHSVFQCKQVPSRTDKPKATAAFVFSVLLEDISSIIQRTAEAISRPKCEDVSSSTATSEQAIWVKALAHRLRSVAAGEESRPILDIAETTMPVRHQVAGKL